MALVGVELEMLVSEPDALTFRPQPFVLSNRSKRKKSTKMQKRLFSVSLDSVQSNLHSVV